MSHAREPKCGRSCRAAEPQKLWLTTLVLLSSILSAVKLPKDSLLLLRFTARTVIGSAFKLRSPRVVFTLHSASQVPFIESATARQEGFGDGEEKSSR